MINVNEPPREREAMNTLDDEMTNNDISTPVVKKSRRIFTLLLLVLLAVIIFVLGLLIGRASIEKETVTVYKYRPPEYVERSLAEQLQTDAPIEAIKDDLTQRPDLISYEPVLGGTMGFYDRDRIQVLTGEWVFAPFEDGHRGGFMLLRFEIEGKDEISWEVKESYLY